jgi:polyisoprenoid-binding protein YceI
MKPRHRLIACTPLLIAATAVADEWRVDKATSRLNFVPTFEGRPTVGQFRDFAVQLRFDPSHPETGQMHVTVSLMSADLSSKDINEAIRESEWLDVARYPKAEFESSRIRGSNGRYVAEGTLKLKGAIQAIEVPFDWSNSEKEATMVGKLKLDRTDFRIGTGEWSDSRSIGHPVEVRFNLSLERSS